MFAVADVAYTDGPGQTALPMEPGSLDAAAGIVQEPSL